MHYTYVLLCINQKRKRFYVGSTDNIPQRLNQHKTHSVQTTKSFNKIELVYFEACRNKTDARRREIQLKTGFGRGYINRRIESDIKDAGIV